MAASVAGFSGRPSMPAIVSTSGQTMYFSARVPRHTNSFWSSTACGRAESAHLTVRALSLSALANTSSGRAASKVQILRAQAQASPAILIKVAERSVSVLLLSGGVGSRMKAKTPKQYLELRGQPLCTYSLRTFIRMPEVLEVVVVCELEWEHVFRHAIDKEAASSSQPLPQLKFARPGKERQHSVFNGLSAIDKEACLVAVHDSARPLVSAELTLATCRDALTHGAAVLAVPAKATIKRVGHGKTIRHTLPREELWEAQTPQVVCPKLLRRGFAKAHAENVAVTDDVSLVEALGEPVVVTLGSYVNLKVTTSEDLVLADRLLDS